MKNNKGITLIALVVTIIVLLILAAVAISTLFGQNGLITRAQGAQRNQKTAEFTDVFATEVASSAAAYLVELDEEKYAEALNNAIGKAKEASGLATSATFVGNKSQNTLTVSSPDVTFETKNVGTISVEGTMPNFNIKFTKAAEPNS